mgnify:FL=1
MLTERTTTLFVSIFYFQKCQTRDIISRMDGPDHYLPFFDYGIITPVGAPTWGARSE